jgi:hypothetical protein
MDGTTFAGYVTGYFGCFLVFAQSFCMGYPANQLSMACHQGILKLLCRDNL